MKVGQDSTAEAEGRSATAKVVDHRASLEKVVDEPFGHSPDTRASDLVHPSEGKSGRRVLPRRSRFCSSLTPF